MNNIKDKETISNEDRLKSRKKYDWSRLLEGAKEVGDIIRKNEKDRYEGRCVCGI